VNAPLTASNVHTHLQVNAPPHSALVVNIANTSLPRSRRGFESKFPGEYLTASFRFSQALPSTGRYKYTSRPCPSMLLTVSSPPKYLAYILVRGSPKPRSSRPTGECPSKSQLFPRGGMTYDFLPFAPSPDAFAAAFAGTGCGICPRVLCANVKILFVRDRGTPPP